MTNPAATIDHPRGRLLDFRSGGWLLLLSALLCCLTIALWAQRLSKLPPAIGDGENIETYGYDLSTCLVPRDTLVPANFPKDGIPAMTNPEVFTLDEMEQFAAGLRRGHQGKFLVDSDRVIGVRIGKEARAYPLRIIAWHEIVNDTLADEPIAVTYNPLCDSTVVFDRVVNGETLEFGVSGLVYNSNLVLYDRRDHPADESLWSQLQFRAIAGPAAAQRETLDIRPAVVVRWEDWRSANPQTTVLAPERARLKVYKASYKPYFGSEMLRFPVSPTPSQSKRDLKTPMIALRTTGDWHTFELEPLAMQATTGDRSLDIDGVPIECIGATDPPTLWPKAPEGESLDVVYSFWFAWYSHHATTAQPID